MLFLLDNVEFSAVSFGGGVGLVKSSLVFAENWHSVDKFRGGQLGQSSDCPRAKSEQDSSQVHAESDRGRSEEGCENVVANHDVLNVQLGEQDDEEPPIVVNTNEDVEFSSISSRVGNLVKAAFLNRHRSRRHRAKDTTVNHVEEVHHDETLEHEGLVKDAVGRGAVGVLHLLFEEIVRIATCSRSGVQKDDHYNHLVENLR